MVSGHPCQHGVATGGSTDETTISITDDDLPDVNVSFGAGSYSADEGDSTEVSVTLDHAPERQVTVPISKSNQGGATSADYSGVPPSVTFGATDTLKKFTFSALDDTENDDGESVKLTFGQLPDQVSAGTNPETTLNITDGDVPTVNVEFEDTAYTAAEGSTATVKVTLSADPERTVTVHSHHHQSGRRVRSRLLQRSSQHHLQQRRHRGRPSTSPPPTTRWTTTTKR